MFQRRLRGVLIAAVLLFLLMVALLAGLPLRPASAQSSNIMAAPACQCSAPTQVDGGTRLVHCVCGGMSCVISVPPTTSKHSSQLQCVR
ncbi:MAG: hypothetical protein Q8R06_16665 [Polaromonas sp.]|uniref:hypothetical protein n=1 Tax=Comamonadaceae TaxID=80864 RepID=UPI002733F291|nr:hypothetical protein [Polaromonas sp.]MDP3798749.1 hypothetical protein [Polaromonas sp.]